MLNSGVIKMIMQQCLQSSKNASEALLPLFFV